MIYTCKCGEFYNGATKDACPFCKRVNPLKKEILGEK